MSVSLKPKKVSPLIWYYEHKGSIEVVIDAAMVNGHARRNSAIIFRIRKPQLNKSLQRMNGKRGPRRKP